MINNIVITAKAATIINNQLHAPPQQKPAPFDKLRAGSERSRMGLIAGETGFFLFPFALFLLYSVFCL